MSNSSPSYVVPAPEIERPSTNLTPDPRAHDRETVEEAHERQNLSQHQLAIRRTNYLTHDFATPNLYPAIHKPPMAFDNSLFDHSSVSVHATPRLPSPSAIGTNPYAIQGQEYSHLEPPVTLYRASSASSELPAKPWSEFARDGNYVYPVLPRAPSAAASPSSPPPPALPATPPSPLILSPPPPFAPPPQKCYAVTLKPRSVPPTLTRPHRYHHPALPPFGQLLGISLDRDEALGMLQRYAMALRNVGLGCVSLGGFEDVLVGGGGGESGVLVIVEGRFCAGDGEGWKMEREREREKEWWEDIESGGSW